VAENKRRLQPAFKFPGAWVSAHRNPHRFPIWLGELCAFPAIKEPGVAVLFGVANARPKLPRPIRRLPNRKIHWLLLGIRQLSQIRVARDLPPLADNARFSRGFSGARDCKRRAEDDP